MDYGLDRVTSTAYDLFLQGSGTFPSGYRATQLANSNLKWEAATQYNVGLDYTLFGNTLYGTVDAAWDSVTHLQGAQLHVRTILNVVSGSTTLIGCVHGAQTWDRRTGIVGIPSIEQTGSLVRTTISNSPEVGLELLVVIHILVIDTLPKEQQPPNHYK